MAYRRKRTPEEQEHIKARCLEAWNANELSRNDIARELQVGQTTLSQWVQEWLAAGLTTRQPRPHVQRVAGQRRSA